MRAPKSPALCVISVSQLGSLRLQVQRDLPEATRKGLGTLHDARNTIKVSVPGTSALQAGRLCSPVCARPRRGPRHL